MNVELSEPLASGAPFVAPVLTKRLRALHRDPAGAHTLSSLGVSVNVRIEVGAAVGTPPDGAEIALAAEGGEQFFPVFHGTLRVEAVDTFSSLLVLRGDYDVPFGILGKLFDRTVLLTVAERSLQTFLGELRDELAAHVLRQIAH
jgi:hypothetical protein